MEYSNFVPQGTTHRDLPSSCPAQYRSRIETLRTTKPNDEKWRNEQLDKCARVAREIALDDAKAFAAEITGQRSVVRHREPLSVESQQKLLMRAELRQRLWQAERDYSDPYTIGDPDYEEIFDGDDEFDSAKHVAAASYHMEKAEGLEGSDEQHDLDKASAHYKAAAAHLQAANVHGSKDSSLLSKDQATKAAKASSMLANVS